jgi:hypothetical protein
MYLDKIKREKFGKCNICRSEKELSWDHVPPRGCSELKAVEIISIFHTLTSTKDEVKRTISQNGLKFRTICRECNSLLGKKYDPVLIDFSTSVGRYLKSNLHFPKIVHHRTKPAVLIRSILGHLLTAKILFEDGGFELRAREAFFNDSISIPEELFVFYWIYPYSQFKIMRDFIMPTRRGKFKNKDLALYNMLKFFPIAYLISTKPLYEDLFELSRYRDCSIDQNVVIPIQLDRIMSSDWPERIDPSNFIIGGQALVDSIAAKPRTTPKRQRK